MEKIMSVKRLVVVSSGDTSKFEQYSKDRAGKFDVALLYYGENNKFDSSLYDYCFEINKFKYRNIFTFFQEHQELLDKYETFWLPDDDIEVSATVVDQFLEYFEDNQMYIGQPSVNRDGFWSHDSDTYNTAQLLEYEFKGSEVEVMMPIFSKEALRTFLPHFEKSYSSWGLDSLWSHLASRDKKKIGVIHKYSAHHRRQVGSGALYKTLESMGITPMGELKYWADTYDLWRKIDLSYNKPVMRDVERVTFCIPSKSNLRYLKTCIPSIRKNAYRKDHDIIVFVDSDTDGTVDWLKKNASQYNITYYINPFLNEKLFGIGKAYDYCIEHSKTDICMIFHADMMLGKDADLHLYKHLEDKTVVCSTRIEPPIHPNAGEKILMDFGMWPEEFKEEQFNVFVETTKDQCRNKTTTGIFAPWMINKMDLLEIGGHDPIMHSAREDSDLFNRMKLAGYKFVQSWDSLVYHLTGRGGQFQHGRITQDEQAKSEEWRKLMENSTKEFIRKWGGLVKHTPMMDPIVSPKYNIAIVLTNSTIPLLEVLEPWCDKIIVDCNPDVYIEKEQDNTKYNLTERIESIRTAHVGNRGDIEIHIDSKKFNEEDYKMLQQMSEIIKDSGEVGKFEIGNMVVIIHNIEELQGKLIVNYEHKRDS